MSKMFSKVMGSMFAKDGQKIISGLVFGDKLDLVREENNQYDKNAIQIHSKGRQIGFVKADAARSLAPRIDEGEEFICLVEQVTGGSGVKENWGCNISLESTSIDSPHVEQDGPTMPDQKVTSEL